MKLSRSLRKLEKELEDLVHAGAGGSHTMRNVGLISAGVTVLAVGVVIGREIRRHYKFTRRTPYDAYEHSGDTMQDIEFGVGI